MVCLLLLIRENCFDFGYYRPGPVPRLPIRSSCNSHGLDLLGRSYIRSFDRHADCGRQGRAGGHGAVGSSVPPDWTAHHPSASDIGPTDQMGRSYHELSDEKHPEASLFQVHPTIVQCYRCSRPRSRCGNPAPI